MSFLLAAFQAGLRPATGVAFPFGFQDTTLALTVRTTGGQWLTLQTSTGSRDTFRDALTEHFADASPKTAELVAPDARVVDIVSVSSPNLLFFDGPPGTVDTSRLPSLVVCSFLDSLCNRFIVNILYGLTIDGAQCAGRPLDLGEVRCSDLRASNTYCAAIVWPAVAPGLGVFVLTNHAIAAAPPLPALPVLKYLDVSTNNASAGAGFGQLDISKNPQLDTLNARDTLVNDLVTVPGMQLSTVNLIFNDFSAPLNGTTGQPESIVALVANCLQLRQLSAYNCGLSAANLEAILDELLATHGTRTVGQYDFSFGNASFHYLSAPINHQRPNESLVTASAQAKLALVQSYGYNFGWNLPVFRATVLTEDTVRIEYISGHDDVTWWQPGDTITFMQSTNRDLVNEGNHTVLSGTGKVFVATNTKIYPGWIGFTGDNNLIVKA